MPLCRVNYQQVALSSDHFLSFVTAAPPWALLLFHRAENCCSASLGGQRGDIISPS
jgi:hypothetical protein